MFRRKSPLDTIRIAKPCTESWQEMSGDDRQRHCAKCDLNVFNISGMTREEAETLLREANGRVCVRLFRRPDGTVITRDCPEGVARQRRRKIATAAMVTAMFGVSGAVAAGGPGIQQTQSTSSQSQKELADKVKQTCTDTETEKPIVVPVPHTVDMGDVMIPTMGEAVMGIIAVPAPASDDKASGSEKDDQVNDAAADKPAADASKDEE